VSTPTLAELVESPAQQVRSTCDAYLGGSLVLELSLTGGSVSADARRSVLRTAESLTFAPLDDYTHAEIYDVLTLPGLELQIQRGFVLADGSEVMAALGRFVVDEVSYQRTPAGSELSVSGSDLSVRIARARWTEPYSIASGTGLAEALADLLRDRWGLVNTSGILATVCPDTLSAKAVFEAGAASDPWSDACNLADAHGYVLYFDPTGIATIRPAPSLSGAAPVYAFAAGATAIITEATRVSPVQQIYNGVIATGEGSEIEAPVRGEAWDDDPSSPTYRYGPLGSVPYFFSSPLLTTTEMCETAAASRLAAILGRVEQLSWSHIPHPGLAPLDVVSVALEAVTRTYILDAVTIPLAASGAMTAVARDITLRS